MAEFNYDKSPNMGKHELFTGIGTDRKGNWTYDSASAEGYVEIELPTLPGSPYPVERLHARDFGAHVVGKIESSMKRPGYMRTGPIQSPAQTLLHYAAVAKGASLMDAQALKQMETIAAAFERADSPQEYFKQTVRPFLHGLQPEKRRP